MIIHPLVVQGSEEWHALRRGRPTASRFKDIITAAKGDLSKSSSSYIAELIGECFVPDWVDFLGNKYTDRGTELEPEARQAFDELTGFKTVEVGFVTRTDGIVGCSPDGLIAGPSGGYMSGLEIKCPSPKVHVGWIMAGGLPDEHKQQVHGSMAVTGLNSWNFFSYFPGLQPFHLVVHRDAYTAKLSDALDQFLIDYSAARSAVISKLTINKPNQTTH
jgi:hypothetical protein